MSTYQPSPRGQAPTVTRRQWLAAATPGLAGADLANLVNEAALAAVRAGRTVLIAADFASALDRVVLGTRDHSATLTTEELATVAVREAGHALVAPLSPYADPVSRVTVLATALVERETITGDQVRTLVRAASPPSALADRPVSANSPTR